MRNKNTQSFHLLFEEIQQRDPAPLDPIEIPDTVCYLHINHGGVPRIDSTPREDSDSLFMLEPIWHGHSPQLLMLGLYGSARVNGRPAPPVALLNVKDEIMLGCCNRYVAHVTLFQKARLGTPPTNEIGRTCPVCRVNIKKDSATYACSCSQLLHCEGEEVPVEDRLDCAQICLNCPTCGSPINLESGYIYLPSV